jgi:predicted metalloprotease with PDZ domain
MRHGLAEQIGLSAGDELLALDGWRLKRTDDLATWHNAAKTQALTVCRDQRVFTLDVAATTASDAQRARAQASKKPAQDLASLDTAPAEVVALAAADKLAHPDIQVRRQAWLHA